MNVRIATYNLFEGASGSYNRLVEFVRDSQLDVICFQEVNGWQDGDNARLRDFTDKVLFTASAYGNSNTEFKLATIGKHAILGKTLHAEAFWHGALETKMALVNGEQLTVVNLHLDPWQEASRDREVARLLAALPPGPTVITGDFNSLSRQDNYPPELLKQLQANGISKFGANALEFTVIDRLLQAGFIDAAAVTGKMESTVPSPFNTDQSHEVPVRVDYIFVSPDLVPRVRNVETVKNDLTNAISDHYPVVLTLDMDGPVATAAPATPAMAMPQPPAPATAPALQPQQPHASYREYPQPAKPWTPEPGAAAEPISAPQPQAPPEPKDDEVTMWSHNSDDNTPNGQ
jgi:exodeoxyribonuclease-3